MCSKKGRPGFYAISLVKNNDFSMPLIANKMTRLNFGLFPAQSAALFCLEQALLDNEINASQLTIITALKSFLCGR